MKNSHLIAGLAKELQNYRVNGKPLPGISTQAALDTLVRQMADSVARVKYVKAVKKRHGRLGTVPAKLDPKNPRFDPLWAAIHYMEEGDVDEAFWLVFLFVLCGKHSTKGYGLVRMVYGAFDDKFVWTWKKFSKNPDHFSLWLHQKLPVIRQARKQFPFGNHRKYESLDKLDVVLKSYADWVGPKKSHQHLIATATANAKGEGSPKEIFDYLYKDMKAVHRFGRTGKFDYLTMLGKMQLANIEPPSAHMVHATGPVQGARLLFAGRVDHKGFTKKQLDQMSIDLEKVLGVGMQVIEDSLCNWQKSPEKYIHFSG